MGVESLIKTLREQNAGLVTVVQQSIGAVTEIMGYYGTAASAIGQVAGLLMGGGQAEQDKLAEIQNKLDGLWQAMNQGFGEVLAADQAQGILARLRDLDQYIVPARSSVELLIRHPPQDPDPEGYPYNDYLRTALDAIGGLKLDDKWQTVFYEPLYERPLESNISDPVDGPIAPFAEVQSGGTITFSGTNFLWGCEKPAKATGDMIFSYTYILPLYLEAILHLTIIVGGCVPDHLTRYKPTYLECADFLLDKHNAIEAGIHKLPLPISTVNNPDPYVGWCLNGRPWGAVEPNSPATSIGCWTTLRAYGDPANAIAADVAALLPQTSITVQEHAVRTLRRWRSVYKAIGLPAVWKTINSLRVLAGEPSLGLDHGLCSLRQLAEDASQAHRRREAAFGKAAPAEALSLHTLAQRLSLGGSVSMKRTVGM